MYLLVLLILLACNCNSPSTPTLLPASTLDPKQLSALQSIGLAIIGNDPCANPATACDNSSPFRHIISLHLSNCLPNHLHLSLTSFHQLIYHLPNLTHLSITNLPIPIPSSSSLLSTIFSHMQNLRSATISNTTLSCPLPHRWHSSLSLSHLDLSSNSLKGPIPKSITLLQSLQSLNLSSNSLSGLLPDSIGHLIFLKSASFARNSLSGPLPETMAAIPELAQLDLSFNRFNGSIPRFLSEMSSLRRLNLESNDFRGVVPFNASFIERLELFRVGGNANLCYNRSVLSSKLELGIAPCDMYGFPVPPPLGKADKDDSFSDYDYGGDEDGGGNEKGGQHGVNRVVLGVAIGLSCLFFLLLFLVCLSKLLR